MPPASAPKPGASEPREPDAKGPKPKEPGPKGGSSSGGGARSLARALTGDLLCARCGYNLRGLSVRGSCPECGLPVRTTILMLVDPKAEEFEPLSRPRVTGAGMVLWSVGGLAAAVCVWVLRGGEVARSLGARGVDAGFWTILGLAGVVLSAIGALVLIRPTRRTRARQTVLAAMGVLVYLPIAGVFWWIHWHLDGRHPDPYGEPTLTSEARTTLRLAMGALCVMSILLVRRNARGLALRSHLLRSGQIDRQSLLGLAGAFGIAAVGDFIMLFVDNGVLTSEYMRTAGVAMISLGSFLITVGMFAVVLDTVRLYPVLAGRSVGLSDILESNRGRSRRGRADA